MKAMPFEFQQESLLYRLYQDLPIGVVFLDSHGKVLSANRQFRRYFPFYAEGPYGLLLCSAIQCRQVMRDKPCGKADICENCALVKGIQQMIQNNIPMEAGNWNCQSLYQGHQAVKWFRLSGVPVSDSRRRFAALFFEDITARMQKENSLEEKMRLDLPTGVLNQYGFMQSLISLLSSGREEKFTLCMTDLDNFKGINDRYGHLTGDQVLQTFSEVSRKSIRTGDIIGRYGGDEFLFLFHHIRPQQAANIISRIQKELREACRNLIPTPVSFSAGMVFWKGKEQPDIRWKDLIKAADRMLYKAKSNGKGQIVFHLCHNSITA
jgi:diguanylate cyclase (GGDEF)-like protein